MNVRESYSRALEQGNLFTHRLRFNRLRDKSEQASDTTVAIGFNLTASEGER